MNIPQSVLRKRKKHFLVGFFGKRNPQRSLNSGSTNLMNGFEKMFSRWNEGFYAQPFYFLSEFIALIIGFVFVRKYKIGLLFLVYITFDFSIFIIDMYIQNFSSLLRKDKLLLFSITNTLIYLIEISVYYYFFYNALNSIRVKKFIIFSYILFNCCCLTYLMARLLNRSATYVSDTLGALEFILLIPICFTYYRELFNEPIINLFQRPSFWITTGIFFYASVSLPYYLLNEPLFYSDSQHYRKITSLLFNIPFGINFLFLTRAFLCKRHLTI